MRGHTHNECWWVMGNARSALNVNCAKHNKFGCWALRNAQKARALRVTEHFKSLFIMCYETRKFEGFKFYRCTKNVFLGDGIYRERLLCGCVLRNNQTFGFCVLRNAHISRIVCGTEHTTFVFCARRKAQKTRFVCVFYKRFGLYRTKKNYVLCVTERTVSEHCVNYGTHRTYGPCALRNTQMARITNFEDCFCALRNAYRESFVFYWPLTSSCITRCETHHLCVRVFTRARACTVRIASL